MELKKLALGAGAAILTTGLIGGAAFAAFSPAATTTTAALPTAADPTVDEAGKPGGGLKAILDKLVNANTITAAQRDAILAAVKDTANKPRPDHPKGVLGGLLKTATTYLGLEPKALMEQLHAGKSLGEIAGTTPAKSRDGLMQALTSAATTRIDAAVADKKLTADQATKLKAGLATHIAHLVDHKAGPRPKKP